MRVMSSTTCGSRRGALEEAAPPLGVAGGLVLAGEAGFSGPALGLNLTTPPASAAAAAFAFDLAAAGFPALACPSQPMSLCCPLRQLFSADQLLPAGQLLPPDQLLPPAQLLSPAQEI